MDVQQLVQVLLNTLRPETAIRQQAERTLHQLEATPGYPSCLLQILSIADSEMPFQIKQAASLRLKNLVTDYWSILSLTPEELASRQEAHEQGQGRPPFCFSPPDRQIIKDNLFETLLQQSHELIRVQLLECVSKIAAIDFPQAWPSLGEQLMTNLHSDQVHRLCGALCVLKVLLSRSHVERLRKVLGDLIQHSFPLLHTLYQKMLTAQAPESTFIRYMAVKSFYMSTRYHMPAYFQKQTNNFDVWMQVVVTELNQPAPAAVTAIDDAEQRFMHPFWKAKKWASRVMSRTLQLYGSRHVTNNGGGGLGGSSSGNSRSSKSAAAKAAKDPKMIFSRHFETRWSDPLLVLFVNMLASRKHINEISRIVVFNAFSYMDMALLLPSLKRQMQKHAHSIVSACIFPQLCLSRDDVHLLQEDPHEFFRRMYSFESGFSDPKSAAATLLFDMVKFELRKTPTASATVQNSLQLILQHFQTYAQQPSLEHAIAKEGAMLMIGLLYKHLDELSNVRGDVERLLLAFVVPEFTSPIGFLRSRAVSLFGRFARWEWQEANHAAVLDAIGRVCGAVRDTEIVVRLKAIQAVASLTNTEEYISVIVPSIGHVFDCLFGLLDELGSEQVVRQFGRLAARMQDHIGPYVMQTTQRVVKLFVDTCAGKDELDDDDEQVALRSAQVVHVLLDAVSSMKETLISLAPVVFPMIEMSLTPNDSLMQFLDDVLGLLNTLVTETSRERTPEHRQTVESQPVASASTTLVPHVYWSVLTRVIDVGLTWGIDFAHDITDAIDTFLGVDPHFMLFGSPALIPGMPNIAVSAHAAKVGLSAAAPYVHQALAYLRYLLSDETDVIRVQWGLKLAESLFAHTRGLMPAPLLLELFAFIVPKMVTVRGDDRLKIAYLNVLGLMAYNNPAAFLAGLGTLGAADGGTVLTHWALYANADPNPDAETVAICESPDHTRRALLGLGALFLQPPSMWPEFLRNAPAMQNLLSLQVKLLDGMLQSEWVKELERMEKRNQRRAARLAAGGSMAEEEEEEEEEEHMGGGDGEEEDEEEFEDDEEDGAVDDDDDYVVTSGLLATEVNRSLQHEEEEEGAGGMAAAMAAAAAAAASGGQDEDGGADDDAIDEKDLDAAFEREARVFDEEALDEVDFLYSLADVDEAEFFLGTLQSMPTKDGFAELVGAWFNQPLIAGKLNELRSFVERRNKAQAEEERYEQMKKEQQK